MKIEIKLPAKYVSIVPAAAKLIPRGKPINNAILKSQAHIHLPPEIKICKKKNVKIHNAQINPFKRAMSVKATHVTAPKR
jgi:hypothetical protein